MSNTRPCYRCGEQIPAERIEALPETRICIKCSEEIGGEFEVTARAVNIGKEGSLKKNYGSISVSRRRKEITPKD